MEFRVGNKVKVIDNRYTFGTYDRWINKYAMQYKQNWEREQVPSENNEYIIKVKAPRGIFDYNLYLIENTKTKQVYIIDEDGIELIKRNKTFFKKLPNDYTGTIEVENGYIVEKEILDEKEKEYLSAVIRPFRDRVDYIVKQVCEKEYIKIELKNENYWEWFSLPYFEKDTMYKGMEIDKKYTLKELGLDE